MESSRAKGALDPSLAARLYQQHAPVLLAHLRRRTASWEDAEDLVLEVFLAALEGEAVFAVADAEQLPWLLGVAQHKLVDYYRRRAHHPLVPLDERATLAADEAQTPEEVALRHERQTQVQRALQQLPASYQEVVYLRFAQGLPYAEIGVGLGKSEGAVRILLWRALKLLHVRYQEYA